ncbi:MAG: LysE family translocator [Rhodospirillaceae bacterium]|nr:LysE family translocator [Rhodospirillaceae bacterium]
MPSLETLIVFTAAAFVLSASPGPSNLYLLARSVSQGHRAGLVAALGLAAGGLVHVAGAALGLAALFHHSAMAFTILKYVGAAYLVWLGIQCFRDGSAATPIKPAAPRPLGRIFRESVLVEMLNPKVALFFLAFLPQFVDPAAGPIALQTLILGLIVTATALPCDVAIAILSARIAGLLQSRPIWMKIQNWISGTILIGLGAAMALARRN